MNKTIYRVYDVYCTGDSILHSDSKEMADKFCENLNKKDRTMVYRVEAITLNVPHWPEDKECMPG